ncbi:hypothetical protein Tco_0988642 [Tanacetum coccineum]|uniref:Uncharacterized protein n=1 Tax=Tanacetum coccineum TaxID=301880 RepID=A0ABQ5ERZ5_9ASTR
MAPMIKQIPVRVLRLYKCASTASTSVSWNISFFLELSDSKTRASWKLSCLLEAARQSLACIRLGLRGQSCLHAPSTGCGPDVCAIRDCCSLLPEEIAAPCLQRRLAAPCLLRRLAAPYLLRRHYSLVIVSGPKVTFVTSTIPVDRSNME